MPIKISINKVKNLIARGNPVDALLDRLVESAENRVGDAAEGVGTYILDLFNRKGQRVQLSDREIAEKLSATHQVDHQTTEELLEQLIQNGILLKTSSGRYELANNLLAQKAQAKVESEYRVLRQIKATIQDRMSRNELLDKAYLDYIQPNLKRVDLDKEEKAFVTRSQRAVKRSQRIVLWFLIGALTLIALLATVATRNWFRANKENKDLRVLQDSLSNQNLLIAAQLDSIQIAQSVAEAAAREAKEQEKLALQYLKETQQEKYISDSLRIKSDSLRQDALREAEIARKATARAQKAEEVAKTQEAFAKAQEAIAKKQAAIADSLSHRAKQLNKVFAVRVANVRANYLEDPKVKGLIALYAYQTTMLAADSLNMKDGKRNKNAAGANSWYSMHPDIFRPLYQNLAQLNSKHDPSTDQLHQKFIRALAVDSTGKNIYTTGSDGEVFGWPIKRWFTVGAPKFGNRKNFNADASGVNNCMALHPENHSLIVGGEQPYIQLFDTKNKHKSTIPLSQNKEILEVGWLPGQADQCYAIAEDQVFFLSTTKKEETSSQSIAGRTAFTTSGDVILAFSGSYDDQVDVYDLVVDSIVANQPVRTEMISFPGPPQEVDHGRVTAAAVANIDKKSNLMVLGFANGTILFIVNGAQAQSTAVRYFQGKNHLAAISDIKFSADERFLAVSSLDGTVSVWDTRHYFEELYQPTILNGNNGFAMTLDFIPNKNILVVGHQEGQLSFWNLDPAYYAEALCDEVDKKYDSKRYSANDEFFLSFFGAGIDPQTPCR